MKIELSQREIELIVHLLTEQVSKVDDGKSKLNFSLDELLLLEKLERSLNVKNLSVEEGSQDNNYIN